MPESDETTYNLCLIGAGFGRTGTSSLKAALKVLYGRPCYHMSEVLDRDHMGFWIRAARKQVSIDEYTTMFKPYAATVDCPASLFWRDIYEAHPNAKIILSVRDADRWFESCEKTVFRTDFTTHRDMPLGIFAISHLVPYWRRFSLMSRLTWGPLFKDDFSRDSCVRAFEEWNADVKQACPPDKLLVFDVKEGWGPLCKFLDLPIPSTPFPHLNDSVSFQRIIQSMNALGIKLISVAGVMALGLALITLMRTRRSQR